MVHPPAITAINEADLLLLGPGSLFTSVLPHLSVPRLARAVIGCSAQRVYVCNVMTQPGETDGFTAADHLEKVLDAAPGGVDVIVVHEGPLDPAATAAYAAQGQEPVRVDHERLEAMGVRVVGADLAEEGRVVRHSPEALAARPDGAGAGARRALSPQRGCNEKRGHATVATNTWAAVDWPRRFGPGPAAATPSLHLSSPAACLPYFS